MAELLKGIYMYTRAILQTYVGAAVLKRLSASRGLQKKKNGKGLLCAIFSHRAGKARTHTPLILLFKMLKVTLHFS